MDRINTILVELNGSNTNFINEKSKEVIRSIVHILHMNICDWYGTDTVRAYGTKVDEYGSRLYLGHIKGGNTQNDFPIEMDEEMTTNIIIKWIEEEIVFYNNAYCRVIIENCGYDIKVFYIMEDGFTE